MNRKELLSIPERDWKEELKDVVGVYVIPSRRKHESGWACMDFVAEFKEENKPRVRFGGCCDDVSFEGAHFRMDCDYPSGIIHIWCGHKPFTVSSGLSSLSFVENT